MALLLWCLFLVALVFGLVFFIEQFFDGEL
jgi:hypothetical protein